MHVETAQNSPGCSAIRLPFFSFCDCKKSTLQRPSCILCAFISWLSILLLSRPCRFLLLSQCKSLFKWNENIWLKKRENLNIWCQDWRCSICHLICTPWNASLLDYHPNLCSLLHSHTMSFLFVFFPGSGGFTGRTSLVLLLTVSNLVGRNVIWSNFWSLFFLKKKPV